MEGRGLTKGNPGQRNKSRTQGREQGVPSALERIRQAATEEKERSEFTSLFHHLDLGTPQGRILTTDEATPGVDGVTWEQYEEELERTSKTSSTDCTGAHTGRNPRRAYIPKPDGRQRPLGVATVTGKGTPVQSAFGLRGDHSSIPPAAARQRFELLKCRTVLGVECVILRGSLSGTFSVPRDWTSIRSGDHYQDAGVAPTILRLECLIELTGLVRTLSGSISGQ